MIELNGSRVPGHDIKVRGNFRIEEKDLSGQSSATDTAEEGIKRQVLSVTLVIRFEDGKDLTRLIALARAVDENGQRVVYDIVNETAKAANIHQVKFSDNFTYSENDTQSWQVSFSLREFLSVPEKVEARQEQPAAEEQSAEGDTVADAQTDNTQPENTGPDYSGIRGFVKTIDEFLA